MERGIAEFAVRKLRLSSYFRKGGYKEKRFCDAIDPVVPSFGIDRVRTQVRNGTEIAIDYDLSKITCESRPTDAPWQCHGHPVTKPGEVRAITIRPKVLNPKETLVTERWERWVR